MKKILSIAFGLLATLGLNAQSFQGGSLVIQAGAGIGGYGVTERFGLNNNVETDTDGTASTFFPIKVEYGLSELIGIGVFIKPGSFINDNDSTSDYETNSTMAIGADIGIHLINGDRFDLYVAPGIGTSTFKYGVNYTGYDADAKYAGLHYKVNVGMRKYFGEALGIFVDVGYNAYNYDVKSFSENGTNADLNGVTWEYDVSGVEASVGLVLKL